MQILNTRTPELDPNDISGSFREITRYLTATMEAIDFNLAKNNRNILSSGGSASGLQTQIDLIRADIVLLNNALNGISNQLNTITRDLSALQSKISEIESGISDLDARVSALEESP